MKLNYGIVVLVMVGALGLSGCASNEPRSYVGETLAQVEKSENPGIVYDLSGPVLGAAPRYNGGADPSAWTVIAACAGTLHDDHLIVAVLPSTSVDRKILSSAKKGSYQKSLTGCQV